MLQAAKVLDTHMLMQESARPRNFPAIPTPGRVQLESVHALPPETLDAVQRLTPKSLALCLDKGVLAQKLAQA
eukprot:6050209-Amphidinium_carterae.1